MLTPTATRVQKHTSPSINEKIRRETEERISYFKRHPEEIPDRLKALDEEWDIERALETGSSTLTLAGIGLGLGVNRKWFLLSIGVQAFFMQHALQGWCPPLPVFRSLGFRTQREIEAERHALSATLASRTLQSNVSSPATADAAHAGWVDE